MQKIYRKQRIEGTIFSGVIKNGGYHYSDFSVYSDGRINCWQLTDLAGFKAMMERQWVVLDIPSGEALSIYNVGSYVVEKYISQHNPDTYSELVLQKIKQLNPNMENIFVLTEAYKKNLEERSIRESPTPTFFYEKEKLFNNTIDGDGLNLIINYPINENSQLSMVHLTAYKDENVDIFYGENKIWAGNVAEAKLFLTQSINNKLNEGDILHIADLCQIKIKSCNYFTELDDLIFRIDEIILRLNNNKTLMEQCRDTYHNYLEYPCDSLREKLKELYEKIPEDQRMYLGDMDSKDADYYRIIYCPEEKREV